MIYLLDFRVADVGGAVVPGRILPMPGLGTENDLRAETTVTFLTHGFNVNRPSGRDLLLRLARSLPVAGALVAVLWPGDHFTRAISYSFEGRDADDSAAMLARYIGLVVARGSELSFVSHSLGARLVLETIKRLNKQHYAIGQLCLMAAAIDDFSLAHPDNYLTAVPRAKRVVVLASRGDNVLRFAYPAGDLLQAFIFFMRDRIGLALGFHGPRNSGRNSIPTQVYHEQIPDGRRADHSHYLPDETGPPSQLSNQASAVRFVHDVLRNTPNPKYS